MTDPCRIDDGAPDDVRFPWDDEECRTGACPGGVVISCTAADLGGWAADPDGPDLTPAEQAGLDALCAAVTEEIGDQDLWYGASDLASIIEATLFQMGRLIRTGQPLTLPALGVFARRHLIALGPARAGIVVDFEPDPLLLEDAL